MQTRLIAALLSSAMLTACAAQQGEVASTTPPAPVTVQILAINDFHGNLETPRSPYSWAEDGEMREAQLGGAAELASTLEALRTQNSVTVAAGDMIGASPLVSSLFLDEPSITALSRMGLEIASVGNHEFDRGIDELRRIQDGGCEQYTQRQPCAVEPFAGAGFSYLAANVVDQQSGETLFPGTVLREVGGAQIGFIGMTLEGTPNLVAAQATDGFDFFDEAETANRLAAELIGQGADAIVLLIHEGANVDPRYNTLGCPGLSGAIVPIVEQLDPSISVVVSGHTHQAYFCYAANNAGGETLLTSGGRYASFVTNITMQIDLTSSRVVALGGSNVPVDGEHGRDPAMAAYVETYAEASGPVANRPVGTIAPPAEAGENCGDRPAQDFVADSYLAAANSALPEPIDLAFVNSGGVRTNLDGAADGILTFGELAAMAPFGNGIIVLEMTGTEIRNVLEQQFCEENGDVGICDSVLIPSAGMQYAVDLTRPEGQRVVDLTLNGQPIDGERTYRVATNSFLVGGGDGFAQFSEVAEIANVGFDIDALEAYVAAGDLSVPVCGRVQNIAPRD